MDLEIQCSVHGKVQDVNYREYVKKQADELEVFGITRNLPEGSVEVIAQGEKAILEEFVSRLKKGPIFSRVDHVDVEWYETLSDSYSEFEIE